MLSTPGEYFLLTLLVIFAIAAITTGCMQSTSKASKCDESDDLAEIQDLECRACEITATINALQEFDKAPVYKYVDLKGELARVHYRLGVAKSALEEKRKKAAGQNPTA